MRTSKNWSTQLVQSMNSHKKIKIKKKYELAETYEAMTQELV